MAIDLASRQITVITLNPGWLKTDMGGPLAPTSVESGVQQIKKTLDKLQFADTGKFIQADGTEILW